jgi:hypothetical protein
MSVVDAQLKVYGIENPRRWLDHAARDDWQHHGSLQLHRRACRGSLAERPQIRDIVGVAFEGLRRNAQPEPRSGEVQAMRMKFKLCWFW